MGKRKATTSPLELVNGDDHGLSNNANNRRSETAVSTPKRALGSGVSVVPSSLTFDTPAAEAQQYSKLDDKVSEKMTKVNESFINSVAIQLSDQPDAILFPVVESYVRHVHAILTPHLPKYLTELDDDTSFASLARFLDKIKFSIEKTNDTSDIKSVFPQFPLETIVKTESNRIIDVPEKKIAAAGFAAVVSTEEKSTLPTTTTTTTTTTNADEEGPSEEPPKNEFKQVKEDNALYEVRCKVFGKPAGGDFKSKGLGQLFVKKLDSGKYQVVVRGENNLGTILLNILLQKGLPLSVNGNSVMTTDPVGDNGKPIVMLIRVKTEAAANELFNKLQGFLAESS